MRVLTDSPTASVEPVREALAATLAGGPTVAVLPEGPAGWRANLAAAVRTDRDAAPGLVVPTSGSGGDPVGVLLSATALQWSAQRTVERLGGPATWVLALPLTHIAGLMVLTRAVVSGSPLVRMTGDWAAAVAGVDGRCCTALVPTQLRRLLASDPGVLRRFDHVLVGGAALDDDLRGWAKREEVAVVESYGMTETCGGCLHDGIPLDGVQVELDENGVVCLDGPMLADAYRRPDRDEPLARPFVTRDVAEWDDGRLRVLGRLDDVVMSGGVTVPLPAVDALLLAHPQVVDAAAVAVPDDEWGARVVAVVVADRGLDPASLRSFVAARAEPAYVPRSVVVVDDLGRPGPGKLNRAALATLVSEV